MNHDNKLSFAEKLGYGMGDAACGIVYSSVTMFLTWFYTDIYGLSAAAVGVMFLVTRVLDAITDPLTGIVADRVKTRWGHFRPWLIWFAVPYAVLAVMTFTTPEFGASGKLVYAYLTYTLLMLCYTFINIPYCALGGVITRDEKDRLSAQSYRFTISSLAGLMVSVATLFLVDFFGKENKQFGFQATMGIMGAIAIVMLAFCFFSTKERVAPAVEQQGSIREDLRQLLANDQWRIVAIITFFLQYGRGYAQRRHALLCNLPDVRRCGVSSGNGHEISICFHQRRWHDYRQHRRRMAGQALSRGIAV